MGMAEGCIPVMTEVSGTSEVITSGEDGYLVPVGDMQQMARIIKYLDQNRDQLVSLGLNAHKKIKAKYSMDEYVPWFTNIVNEISKKPARPWPPSKSPMSFEAIHSDFTRLDRLFAQASKIKNKKNLSAKKITMFYKSTLLKYLKAITNVQPFLKQKLMI